MVVLFVEEAPGKRCGVTVGCGMSMRHRYAETTRRTPTPMMMTGSFSTPSLNKQSQDVAANWFQRRKQNYQIMEPQQKGNHSFLRQERDANEERIENMNRAQTAPAKPKSEGLHIMKSLKGPLSCDQESSNIDRPSTGKLVRQCLKCKVLYTTSHFCPRHSASTPTLLQPIPNPLPISMRKTSGAMLRASPYTRCRYTPNSLKK